MIKLRKTLLFSTGVALTTIVISVPTVLAFTLKQTPNQISLNHAKKVGLEEKKKLIDFFQNENNINNLNINNSIKSSKSQKKNISETWNKIYEKTLKIGKTPEQRKMALVAYVKIFKGFEDMKKATAEKSLSINISTKKFKSFKNSFSGILSVNEKNIEKTKKEIESIEKNKVQIKYSHSLSNSEKDLYLLLSILIGSTAATLLAIGGSMVAADGIGIPLVILGGSLLVLSGVLLAKSNGCLNFNQHNSKRNIINEIRKIKNDLAPFMWMSWFIWPLGEANAELDRALHRLNYI